MFDTHLHTQFSSDSKMQAKDVAKLAKDSGIGIIITEHLDLDYPENPEAFLFDFKEYFKTLGHLQNDHFLLGVELGLRPDCTQKNTLLVKDQPFDEIIGSIHVVDGWDVYSPSFSESRTKQVAYKQYLDAVIASIESFDDFDTLGHIDYICRYVKYPEPEIELDVFYDEWTTICKVLIAREKALEINTRRFDNSLALEALIALYKRYKELGGKYVTIGSDAHNLSDIGKNFASAFTMVEQLDLQPVYFKQRKMHFDKR